MWREGGEQAIQGIGVLTLLARPSGHAVGEVTLEFGPAGNVLGEIPLTSAEVLASLIGFAVVYGVVAVVWFRLIRHLARQPLAPPADISDKSPELAPVY